MLVFIRLNFTIDMKKNMCNTYFLGIRRRCRPTSDESEMRWERITKMFLSTCIGVTSTVRKLQFNFKRNLIYLISAFRYKATLKVRLSNLIEKSDQKKRDKHFLSPQNQKLSRSTRAYIRIRISSFECLRNRLSFQSFNKSAFNANRYISVDMTILLEVQM